MLDLKFISHQNIIFCILRYMADTCKLCHKLFSSPRLLPCLHVFDLQCISKCLFDSHVNQKILSQKKFGCPECKLEAILDGDVFNLPIYWPSVESVL